MSSRSFPTFIEEKGISLSCFIVPVASGKSLGPIKFIIDTGSPISGISEVDANKFNIDIDRLPRSHMRFGSLGGNIQAFELGKTLLLLQDGSGKVTDDLDVNMLYVFQKPIGKGRRDTTSVTQVNLLGRDFLEKHKLRFVVDFGTRRSCIEE